MDEQHSRRVKWRSRRTLIAAGILAVAVVAAIGSSVVTQLVMRERYTPIVNAYRSLEERIEAIAGESGTQAAAIDELESAVGGLRSDLRDAEQARDAAESRADAAEAEMEALRARYDPDIRAALAAATDSAVTAACEAAQAAVDDGAPPPEASQVIDLIVGSLEGVDEIEARRAVDREAVDGELARCTARASVTADKPDGYYLVNTEIAPGKWRARGGGASCQWSRLADTSGSFESAIGSGFGVRNVVVTIEGTDAAFSSQGCAGWTYLGP